jgi:hypothetical protein
MHIFLLGNDSLGRLALGKDPSVLGNDPLGRLALGKHPSGSCILG